MRRYFSIWSVLLIALLVHLDWHFGRGHHHRLSLGWPYHWVLGLLSFFVLARFCARKWPEAPVLAAFTNGLAGLLVGQVIEPFLEILGYHLPLGRMYSAERWYVFFQFLAAALVGLLAGLVVWARRPPPAAN